MFWGVPGAKMRSWRDLTRTMVTSIRLTSSTGTRMFHGHVAEGTYGANNNITLAQEVYDDESSRTFVCTCRFFMQVQVSHIDHLGDFILIACVDRREVRRVRVQLENTRGGRTGVKPPNMYMFRSPRVVETNVLIPADTLGAKASYLTEDGVLYFFEYDGRASNM